MENNLNTTLAQLQQELDELARKEDAAQEAIIGDNQDINGLTMLPVSVEETQQETEFTRPAVVNGRVVKDILITVIGETRYWKVSNPNISELNRAYDHCDYEETDDAVIVTYTKENARWKSPSQSHVLMCAYDATNKYMEHMLGMSFDNNDSSWYKAHPKTVSSGLPEADTITVLNDLVKPYGLGVSQVFIKKGSSAFEEQLEWMRVLGINPMAEFDRNLTNQEYVDSLAPEAGPARQVLTEQTKNWKFEYTDDVKGPCIAMSGGYGAINATGGGHTSYYGPRDAPRAWKMAIKFDRLENIVHHVEPPISEGESAELMLELDIYQCITNNGKTYGTCHNANIKTWSSASNDRPVGYSSPYSQQSDPEVAYTEDYYGKKAPGAGVDPSPTQKSTIANIAKQKKATRADATEGDGKDFYWELSAKERKNFDEFCRKLVNKAPITLSWYERQKNLKSISEVAAAVESTYRTFELENLFNVSKASRWEVVRNTETAKLAEGYIFPRLGDYIGLISLMDAFLLEKCCKSEGSKMFMKFVTQTLMFEPDDSEDEVFGSTLPETLVTPDSRFSDIDFMGV